MISDEPFSVEFHLGSGEDDPPTADQIDGRLREQGATNVRRGTDHGFNELLPIFVGGYVTLHQFALLLLWIRSRTQCQVIVDARKKKIHSHKNCKVRDGSVIVLLKSDEQVRFLPPLDAEQMGAILRRRRI
jgi:hypothetical protein